MDNKKMTVFCDILCNRISSQTSSYAILSEAREFISISVGKNNSFYNQLIDINPEVMSKSYLADQVISVLRSFQFFLENDMIGKTSIQRKAKNDVVNDFLEQAETLLSDKNYHPAISIGLIGASLEEFLRNWIEDENIEIGLMKPSMDSYTKILKSNDLITKQDVKDITSWAGMRNSAAHGKWNEVENINQAMIMLQGVNLFLRKYTK